MAMPSGSVTEPELARGARVRQAVWGVELLMRESPRGRLWFDDCGRINYETFDADLALGEFSRLVSRGDVQERLLAVQALGWLDDRRVISPLIRALRDREWDVRLLAAEALSGLAPLPDWSLAPVAGLLEDREAAVRAAAARAVSCVPEFDASPPLARALGQPSRSVRLAAAWGLEALGSDGILEPVARVALARVLDHEHDPYVVDAAYWALAWHASENERRERFRVSNWGQTVGALAAAGNRAA